MKTSTFEIKQFAPKHIQWTISVERSSSSSYFGELKHGNMPGECTRRGISMLKCLLSPRKPSLLWAKNDRRGRSCDISNRFFEDQLCLSTEDKWVQNWNKWSWVLKMFASLFFVSSVTAVEVDHRQSQSLILTSLHFLRLLEHQEK